ncbi:GntR family transcriptional regulator YhfZ [Shouchella shacheensis]|uniref:GntR family transcriptional regulator YhfZ n=1 Tax=Shouchella shacheensis TaxID=1649580 RepID=UPI00073FDECF|nr:GntR family transcriptional regulator YhfZ [Shouchella shacheensis]
MNEALFSKKGKTLVQVATRLLMIEEGERIPKVESFSTELHVGRGTIQSSIKLLEKEGAIGLHSRGHLGTFLVHKDVAKLHKFSGVADITAVMPLPYSKKYEGLATGFTTEFEGLGMRLNIAFMRGSKPRLEGVLDERYDFAIVSKAAAQEFQHEQKSTLSIDKQLGLHSYVSGHRVFFANPENEVIHSGMRVGIDRKSADQLLLVEAEVGDKEVEYVELNYMHLLKNLEAGVIDATVWNSDEVANSSIHSRPLTSETARQRAKDISETVVVVQEENKVIQYLLSLIENEQLMAIQHQVERGEIIPRY